MKRFDSMLEKDISGYLGKFSRLIVHAPALYRMMTRLLDDRDLPRQMSPLVIAAIAYFILPEDIIPEEKVRCRADMWTISTSALLWPMR